MGFRGNEAVCPQKKYSSGVVIVQAAAGAAEDAEPSLTTLACAGHQPLAASGSAANHACYAMDLADAVKAARQWDGIAHPERRLWESGKCQPPSPQCRSPCAGEFLPWFTANAMVILKDGGSEAEQVMPIVCALPNKKFFFLNTVAMQRPLGDALSEFSPIVGYFCARSRPVYIRSSLLALISPPSCRIWIGRTPTSRWRSPAFGFLPSCRRRFAAPPSCARA